MSDTGPERFAVGRELQRLFEMTELMLPLLSDDGPRMEVPNGRKLALDAARSHPARAEAFILSDLTTSYCHIAALLDVVRSGTVYPYVPMTLLRSALEATARSLWLLAPTSRDERAIRAVARSLKSLEDYERFVSEIPGGRSEHRALRDGLAAACVRLKLDTTTGKARTAVVKSATTTAIFDAIAGINGAGDHRKSLWRMCSAWAHNDDTLIANLSPKSSPSVRSDRLLHVRVEPNEEWINMVAAWLGLDLSRLLVQARQFGASWPGHDENVSRAIALFPNTEVRIQRERRTRQFERPRKRR